MIALAMSVPPEVMEANGGAPAPQAPGMPPKEAPPSAAPMMAPTKPSGQQEKSKIDCLLAVKMLERALPAFGSTGKEGKAILSCITKLGSVFGKEEGETEELMPAELKAILQGLVGPGAPPKPSAPPQGGGGPAGAPPGGPPQQQPQPGA